MQILNLKWFSIDALSAGSGCRRVSTLENEICKKKILGNLVFQWKFLKKTCKKNFLFWFLKMFLILKFKKLTLIFFSPFTNFWQADEIQFPCNSFPCKAGWNFCMLVELPSSKAQFQCLRQWFQGLPARNLVKNEVKLKKIE